MNLFFQTVYLTVFLQVFISFAPVFAQEQNPPQTYSQQLDQPQSITLEAAARFTHLTAADGLSQNVITAIFQDSRGFMWIGTQTGLNRYDGYSFVVYQHDPSNPNSLSHHVAGILEDAAGALWIATQGGGVNRFDPYTETFTHLRHEPDNPNSLAGDVITSIYLDDQGNLWFGGLPNLGDLPRFDPATNTFSRYFSGPEFAGQLQHGAIWDMVAADDGTLWLAADFALLALDPETGEVDRYAPGDMERRLTVLYLDEAGKLWIGGEQGLYQFDPAAGPGQAPQNSTFELYQPGHPILVSDILSTLDGNLWVGTKGDALYQFDPQTGDFIQHLTPDITDATSLSQDLIHHLFRDRAGVLWVGTGSGLNLYDPRQNQISHSQPETPNSTDLASDQVWGITGTPDGRLWIGVGKTIHQIQVPAPGARQFSLIVERSIESKSNSLPLVVE